MLDVAVAGLQEATRRRAARATDHGAADADARPRVLLLDPVMIVRRALADLLRLEGVEVCEAAEPGCALTAVAEWHPTVVIAELHGVQAFIGDIHAVDPALPVIVVSAAFHPGTLPADGRFGAYCSLPKGDVKGLLTAIQEARCRPPGWHVGVAAPRSPPTSAGSAPATTVGPAAWTPSSSSTTRPTCGNPGRPT